MKTNARTLKAVQQFNKDLNLFSIITGEPEGATLYEDAFTSFGLKNVRVEGNELKYDYNFQDGKGWKEQSEELTSNEVLRDYLGFWKACLKRAKKYWNMAAEDLDNIHEGNTEDIEIE